jgi:dTMP kinase
MSAGRFLTLEGIEGAGKSTIARHIGEQLRARGLVVKLTREPGGTPLAERVRQIVLEQGSETLTPTAETLLMFAARRIHLDNLIRPALARGEWVVCDRFTDATRAYQGFGRGVDRGWIEQLAAAVHGDLQPARTFWLDVPVAVGLQRARARSGLGADRFEVETAQFFERVRAGYVEIARLEPGRVQRIDAGTSLAEVQRQVEIALERLLAQP